MAAPAPQSPSSAAWRARFQVFASAAMGMALEVCGPRLLAPAFGNGTIVWSAILAATLAAIGAGNLLGGWLADRHPWRGPVRLALWLGALASVLAAGVAGPVARTLSEALAPQPHPQLVALLATCAILFGPPAALLAAAYPLAFRGALGGLESAGRTAGTLYAASAVGSLVGALLPPLWGVPALGTRGTLWLFAALPALAGGGRWSLGAALVWLAVPGLWTPPALPEGQADRWESALGSYYLEDDGVCQRLRADIPLRPVLSTVPPVFEGGSYYQQLVLARPLADPRPPRRILLLGLGGGTMARLAREAWPEVEMHGVELDPTLLERLNEGFGLPGLGLSTYVGDGRAWLRRLPGPWDLVMVDVSVGATPPAHMSSPEFLSEVLARLAPHGVVALYAPPPLNVSLFQSVRSTFPHSAMLDQVAVGSPVPLRVDGARALADQLGWSAQGPPLGGLHHPSGGTLVTDDRGDFPWWWGMRVE